MIKINKIGYGLLPTTVGNVLVRPSVKIKMPIRLQKITFCAIQNAIFLQRVVMSR